MIYSHRFRYPEFAVNLRSLMKISSSRVSDFAERYGVTEGTVQNWLAGRSFPRKEALHAIAKDYRIPLEKLIGKPEEVEFQNVYSMIFKR